MAGPETRHVLQATYTPVHGAVTRDGRPFVPEQPFLKLAVLRSVLDDAELAHEVMATLPPEDVKDVREAVTAVLAGDTAAAATAIRGVPLERVIRFGDRAVEAEQAVVLRAVESADEALASLATRRMEAIRGAALARGHVEGLDAAVAAELDAAAAADAGDRDQEGTLQDELFARQPQAVKVLASRRLFTLARPLQPLVLQDQLGLHALRVLERYAADLKRAALRAIAVLGKIEPVGYLHLERLQFTPVDYERGELVYSLPLLPGETVRLTHREWSRTEEEYTKLVADSLERVAENALSEKSELTETFNVQEQQGSTFNASTSVSGGFGPVNISSTIGFGAQSSRSRSEQSSARRSREITRKAASRAKEEHKITFRVASVREEEQISFREIANPSERAVRWDFHRLMKKWQIDLYRYDVRLTYDLVIPEPGSYLLRAHARLAELNEMLARPFVTDLSPGSATPDNWRRLARIYDAGLEPPPVRYQTVFGHAEVVYTEKNAGFGVIEIPIPEGYEYRKLVIPNQTFTIREAGNPTNVLGRIKPLTSLNRLKLRSAEGDLGIFPWQYGWEWKEPPKGSTLGFSVGIVVERSARTLAAWQAQCYERLLEAARARWDAAVQRLTAERDKLLEELGRGDALSLRKLEREEIMKGVLRWMLGWKFEFHPHEADLDVRDEQDLEYYSAGSGRVRKGYRALLLRHGELVRFLHHAIEWENVNYVLYPYFWTDPDRWDFKQGIGHPDFQHQSFLRAGAARVVLTIRPTMEEAFLAFMETGKLDAVLQPSDEYFSVAEELKAMAMANYPYTPSANAEDPRNLVDTWYEFTPTGALDVVRGSTSGDG